jgi:hypothetical protein
MFDAGHKIMEKRDSLVESLKKRLPQRTGDGALIHDPVGAVRVSLCLLMVLSKITHRDERIAKPYLSA